MLEFQKVLAGGSAQANPEGPGGYGTILQYTDRTGTLHEREYAQGYVKTTNNRMELMAAIVGLEALTRPCEVELYSDSQYLVHRFYTALDRRLDQKGMEARRK